MRIYSVEMITWVFKLFKATGYMPGRNLNPEDLAWKVCVEILPILLF